MAGFPGPPQQTDVLAGTKASVPWYGWFVKVSSLFNKGFSGTVTTYGPHTNGSMTYVNGVLTSQTPAT